MSEGEVSKARSSKSRRPRSSTEVIYPRIREIQERIKKVWINFLET